MAQTRTILGGIMALWLCTAAIAQTPPQETPEQYQQRMAWWQQARFGMFIHWGPVSLKGTEIGWSRGGERRGTGGKGEIPVDEYDNLYKQFNPVRFNAQEWVALAQDAGMKYLVFTSRHHDGFSMFDSALTDYKITQSPFGRDVARELANACHQANLRLGFYYSPPDWHHPDFRTENHARYLEYFHGQIRELCTNYGRLDILWFDGLGGTAKDWDSEKLFPMIRSLQPQIVINNRAGLPADHDTPEQEIGKFQNTRPWESCITICNQWAWKPDDTMKSLKQCLDTLIRCAGGDGNLLFNVGPMPDGRIEPRQADRLREMGSWLRQYGKSIYATRGGPYKPGQWGASTYQADRVYLHILKWSDETLSLPPLPCKVTGSSLMTGGKLSFKQTDQAIEIAVDPKDRQDIDTIVVLELDKPANTIAPINIHSASLAAGKKATASNVHQKDPNYGPDKAFDDDDATRWATDSGTHQAWLQVDLGKPTAFNRVIIHEACPPARIQKFQLERLEGDAWKPFFEGTTVGEKGEFKFETVTAQQVRLNILEATEGPTIWEFRILPPSF
jgi:alpha-L-fucosidase